MELAIGTFVAAFPGDGVELFPDVIHIRRGFDAVTDPPSDDPDQNRRAVAARRAMCTIDS